MVEVVDLTIYCKTGRPIKAPAATIRVDDRFLQFTIRGTESKVYSKNELKLYKKLTITDGQKVLTIRLEGENELSLKMEFPESPISALRQLNTKFVAEKKKKEDENTPEETKTISFMDGYLRGNTNCWARRKMKRIAMINKCRVVSEQYDIPWERNVTFRPEFWDGEVEELDELPFENLKIDNPEEPENISPPVSNESADETKPVEVKTRAAAKQKRLSSSSPENGEPVRKSARNSPKIQSADFYWENPTPLPSLKMEIQPDATDSMVTSSIPLPITEEQVQNNNDVDMENRNLMGETIQGTTILNCRIVNSKIEKSTMKDCFIENSDIIDSNVTSTDPPPMTMDDVLPQEK